jgi:hypothetical protein
VKLRDIDHGYKALRHRLLDAAKGARVTVGLHEAEGSAASEDDESLTVLDVGIINEFGGSNGDNPPARSFVSGWADEAEEANKDDLRKIGEAVVMGTVPDAKTGLARAGLKFNGDMQRRMRSGIEPENAQSTKDQKGSSTPLINKGQLWGALSYQVHDGKKE